MAAMEWKLSGKTKIGLIACIALIYSMMSVMRESLTLSYNTLLHFETGATTTTTSKSTDKDSTIFETRTSQTPATTRDAKAEATAATANKPTTSTATDSPNSNGILLEVTPATATTVSSAYTEQLSPDWKVKVNECDGRFRFPNVVNNNTFHCDRSDTELPPNVNFTKQNPFHCGGIDVFGGACFVSANSTYSYLTKSPDIGRITPYPYPRVPLCSTPTEYFETRVNRTVPPACQIVNYFSPRDLLQLVRPGFSVSFIGHSHARNQFDAFVAVLRNQATMVMRHSTLAIKSKGEVRQYRYDPVTQTDSYTIYIGKEEREEMLKSHCHHCVTVTFYFARTQERQSTILSDAIARHAHDVLILGFSRGYPFVGCIPEWKQAVLEVISKNPENIIVGHVWFSKGRSEEVAPSYLAWIHEMHEMQTNGTLSKSILVWGHDWLEMPKLHREMHHMLMDKIWHNVCPSMPSYDVSAALTPPLKSFIGLEKCDYLFSKMSAQILVTTAIQQHLRQDFIL